MMTLLEDFLASERLLRDAEVCDLLGWSAETLKAKRARREAPPSIKVKSVHLTRYADLSGFIERVGRQVDDAPGTSVDADLLNPSPSRGKKPAA
jgi:predicted DNA-binding transcriptional regulator AlpA